VYENGGDDEKFRRRCRVPRRPAGHHRRAFIAGLSLN
jgi:hypothetical protein